MHTLHLVNIDRNRPANVARGVRDALRVAGYEGGELAQTIERVLAEAMEGNFPIPLVAKDSAVAVQESAAALENSSRYAATGGVDLTEDELAAVSERARRDEPVSDPEGADYTSQLGEGEDPSSAAAQTALVLLAHADGNIAATFGQARMLGRTTGQAEHYSEVCRLMATAFNITSFG